jgi:ribosomal subunit interface protein
MSFPIINFKATQAEISDNLKDVTENKLRSLEKFIGAAPAICDVEFEKITNHHQQGNIHRVEVNLEVNGKLFRSEATSDSFEKAIDEVRSELDEELRRARGKKETMLKKGGRRLKELLRWS